MQVDPALMRVRWMRKYLQQKTVANYLFSAVREKLLIRLASRYWLNTLIFKSMSSKTQPQMCCRLYSLSLTRSCSLHVSNSTSRNSTLQFTPLHMLSMWITNRILAVILANVLMGTYICNHLCGATFLRVEGGVFYYNSPHLCCVIWIHLPCGLQFPPAVLDRKPSNKKELFQYLLQHGSTVTVL